MTTRARQPEARPSNDDASAFGGRFFFSVRFRGRVLPDREGVELSAETDVRGCARYLAEALARDGALAEVDLSGCAVEVTDASGALVAAVSASPRGSRP